jgi:hypothetical protein
MYRRGQKIADNVWVLKTRHENQVVGNQAGIASWAVENRLVESLWGQSILFAEAPSVSLHLMVEAHHIYRHFAERWRLLQTSRTSLRRIRSRDYDPHLKGMAIRSQAQLAG